MRSLSVRQLNSYMASKNIVFRENCYLGNLPYNIMNIDKIWHGFFILSKKSNEKSCSDDVDNRTSGALRNIRLNLNNIADGKSLRYLSGRWYMTTPDYSMLKLICEMIFGGIINDVPVSSEELEELEDDTGIENAVM